MWKSVASFEVLFQLFPGRAKEHQEKALSVQLVCGRDSNFGSILMRNVMLIIVQQLLLNRQLNLNTEVWNLNFMVALYTTHSSDFKNVWKNRTSHKGERLVYILYIQ
jgi:hypothetical protein